MYRFAVRHILSQPENKVLFRRSHKLIAGFKPVKFILSLNFLRQLSQSVTQLDVEHIGRRKLSRQVIQQRRRRLSIRLIFLQKVLNAGECFGGLASQTNSTGSNTKQFGYLREIHSRTPQFSTTSCSYVITTGLSKHSRGYFPTFPLLQETGGGRHAHHLQSKMEASQ